MKRPSPSMIVAIVALIAALAGTAIALPGRNTVTTGDIKPRNVKSSDIAGNGVQPVDTNLIRTAVEAGTVDVTNTTPTARGGPAVTVSVPAGALVAIHADVTMHVAGSNTASVHLSAPGSLSSTPEIMSTGSNAPQPRYITPGPGTENGTASQVRSGWVVLADVPPGRRTFSLLYSRSDIGSTGLFSDRRLQVMVIR